MFNPLHDIVLIERDPSTSTNGGLIISASKNKPSTGTVLAVGPGKHCEQTGVFVPTTVVKGQTVYFTDKSGYPVDLGGEFNKRDIFVMRELEIIGVIPLKD